LVSTVTIGLAANSGVLRARLVLSKAANKKKRSLGMVILKLKSLVQAVV